MVRIFIYGCGMYGLQILYRGNGDALLGCDIVSAVRTA